MFRIIKKSLRIGVVTGRYQKAEQPELPVTPEAQDKARPFKRSLAIREVDTGSCNACEMEMSALLNPVYDADRFGIHIAASPRHADALVVTGPVTGTRTTSSNRTSGDSTQNNATKSSWWGTMAIFMPGAPCGPWGPCIPNPIGPWVPCGP